MIVIIRRRAGEFAGRVRKRFRSRALEWEHATIMVIFGGILLFNPKVFDGPSSPSLGIADGGPGECWAPVSPVSPRLASMVTWHDQLPLVRALSALSGICLFAAISLGLLFSWTWPTGLAPYPVIGFFGLFSLHWAVFDVAIPDEHDDA